MGAAMRRDRVQVALTALIEYLETLATTSSPDAALAMRAAENLRATFEAVRTAGDDATLEEAFYRARYDVGGKGLHDWVWSPGTEAALQQHTEYVRVALASPGSGRV